MRGRDLLAADEGAEPVVTEAPRGTQLMVVDGSWKLIRTLQEFYYVDRFARQSGTEELYDLDADPAEQRDVSLQRTDVRARSPPVSTGGRTTRRTPRTTARRRRRPSACCARSGTSSSARDGRRRQVRELQR
jgi:hypothetical protein